MKKLYILAITACIVMNAPNLFSQSIVLINGQASEVVLSGNEIESIVNTKIKNYLTEYGQSPAKDFKHVSLQSPKKATAASAIKELDYFEDEATLISLAADRPQLDNLKE